jgi:hypothetical protein
MWSLAVEEQFYLCWPLLFSVLMPRLRRGQVGWRKYGYTYTAGGTQSGIDPVGFLPDEVTEDPTRISFDIEATIQSLKISEEGRKGQVQSYVIAVPKK